MRVGAHSLHSPFIFDFFNQVIRGYSVPDKTDQIERIRKSLKEDRRKINTDSFGAASSINKNAVRPISEIASQGISTFRQSQLLYGIGKWMNSKYILELGTSLGLNTIYLAQLPQSRVITYDGCIESLDIARSNFKKMGVKNVDVVSGNIDDTLDGQLQKIEKLDFVFFDANHRMSPTLRYFDQCKKRTHKDSVFIFDDIHWSKEMKQAWNTIKMDEEVKLSIDLFHFGVVFFNPEFEKTHFILEY